MRLAKQSTLTAILVASLTTAFVFSDGAKAQHPGGASVIRPTDDDLPFAPETDPIRLGLSADSLAAQPMPSQFMGLTEDTVIWPTRTFAIPFNVETANHESVEVQLFVARGPGNQWRMIDQKSSTATEFPFEATDDGLYWFATQTINGKDPKSNHPSIAQPINPQLKIFVDSTRPEVTLMADADAAGRVVAKVSMDDSTPLRSIQLHYVTDSQRQWQSLDVSQLNVSGTLTFQPKDSWQQLSLQAVVTDSAGHQRIVSKLMQRPRVAAITRSADITSQTAQYRTTPTDVTSQSLQAQTVAAPIESQDSQPVNEPAEHIAANPFRQPALLNGSLLNGSFLNGYRGNPAPAHAPGLSPDNVPPSLSPVTAPFQTNQPTGWLPQQLPSPATPDQVTSGFAGPITPAAPDTSMVPPSRAEVQSPPLNFDQPERQRTIADAMRPISDKPTLLNKPEKSIESIPTPEAERDPSAGDDTTAPYATRKLSSAEFDSEVWDGRVPTRYSDSFRFSLDYELEAVGANGAESIELWGSTDGGESWTRWGSDPDGVSPFDIETKDEGIFGFRIVVLGRNGLTTPRPLSGETPDIVIVVDQEKPDVRITGASYGEGDRAGSLVIQYACTDTNLMQRPISLSFSDTQTGPWTTIAAGLQNHGDYVWPADPQLPRRLYLRVDATDRAGNVGSHILDQAIDAQGLAPRARIRGFQTLGGPIQPPLDQ